MKKNTGNTLAIVSIIIGIIIVGVWMFWGKSPIELDGTTPPSTQEIPGSTAKINNKTISLIIADTSESRELGLGGRTSLGEDEAMLFVFDIPDRYEFWMKDMKIPIDIIWLDPAFKIVHIESNVSPETYPDTTFMPESEALYVLEMNALFAQKNDLKIGDVIEVNLKK